MTDIEQIKIRLATREDAVPVTKLLRDTGLLMPGDKDIDEHWDRLWRDNPSCKDFPAVFHFGWVMEYEGRIVGYLGCFPRTYYFNTKPIQVCITSQWGVEKEFRRFTLLLCEKFFNENPYQLILSTTAQDVSGLVFEKFGSGKKIPVGNLQEVYLVPFNFYNLIKHRYKHIFSKLAFLNPFLRLACVFVPLNITYKFKGTDKNLREVDIKAMPEEFNVFWENYLSNCQGLIASRRAGTIKWFYEEGFRKLNKKVYVYYRGTQITGYVSLVEEPVPDSWLKRYKIADLLAVDGYTKSALLKGVLQRAYSLGCDIVEVPIPGLIRRNEIPAFTIKRNARYWSCYYRAKNQELDEKLQRPENWHISSYDGDSALF